jgi:hypothetical protein
LDILSKVKSGAGLQRFLGAAKAAEGGFVLQMT